MCRLTTIEQYLTCVLHSYSCERTPVAVGQMQRWTNRLQNQLTNAFAWSKAGYKPFVDGPFSRRTALNTDIVQELIVPFPKDKFPGHQKAIQQVASLLNLNDIKATEFKGYDLLPKRLHCSFEVKEAGATTTFRIEIVCTVEASQGDYPVSGQLEFCIDGKYPKHPHSPKLRQEHLQNATESHLNCIRLLKAWQQHSACPKLPHFELEALALAALANKDSKSLWEDLATVLQSFKSPKATLTMPDPGNPTQMLISGFTPAEQSVFADNVEEMLSKIRQNNNRLREFFPGHLPYCMAERYDH